MSGIAAVINLDGSPVPQSEIERMANVLKPYGPDRQKVMMRGNAAFAFGLHNLTPEDHWDRQPLLLANRFVMLFDGRIDNRDELGVDLGLPAPELPTMPDSAIALRLFDRWGDGAFERILGEFAIIVADLRERRVLCARDHLGLRVLHYHKSATRFAAATTSEALFALGWVPRVLSKDKVGDTLVQRGFNGETTYYQDIHRILPGFLVRASGEGLSKLQFWDPASIPDVRFKRDDDYVEAFRERLDGAVRARLRSRRTPCATITGGLDSSSIAVIAADMLATSGKTLHTYTAVPEAGFSKEEIRGRYFDETPYVNKIAAKNGNIVAHFVSPSQSPLLQQIAEQMRIGGTPAGGVLNGLWVMDIMAAARPAGHDVMLSGEFGNQTMSYNGWSLLPELLLTGRWWSLCNELIRSGYRWRYLLRHHTGAACVPARIFRRYKQRRRGGLPEWHELGAIRPEFAAASGVVDRAEQEDMPFDAPPPRNGKLDRLRGLHSCGDAADWFATLRARYGVDVRSPAYDRRLVEFCLAIPQDQYLRNGQDRWLIRRAMHGRLPEQVLQNKKAGVQAADWFPRLTRERDRIAAEVTRLAKNPVVDSIIDLPRLTRLLRDWPDHQPPEYGAKADELQVTLPQAIGAAYFLEGVTGLNRAR